MYFLSFYPIQYTIYVAISTFNLLQYLQYRPSINLKINKTRPNAHENRNTSIAKSRDTSLEKNSCDVKQETIKKLNGHSSEIHSSSWKTSDGSGFSAHMVDSVRYVAARELVRVVTVTVD